MKMKLAPNERPGSYLGTEKIGKSWWCRRYTKDKMLARGKGKFWFDERSLYFHRLLTKAPFSIDLESISECETGTWHAGKWAGGKTILKVIWKKDDLMLSSGFLVSNTEEGVLELIEEILKRKADAVEG